MARKLNILDHDDAARPSSVNHTLQSFFWFSQVGQDKSPENKIVTSGVLEIRDAPTAEIDVHAKPLNFQAGQFNAAFINVHPDNSARWPHNFCHAKGHGTNPAPHVQAVHSSSQSSPVQKEFGRRPFDGCQKPQSLGTLCAAPKNVVGFNRHSANSLLAWPSARCWRNRPV